MKRGILGLLVSLVSIVPMLTLMPAGIADAQLQTQPTGSGYIVSCTGISEGSGQIPCDWCTFIKLIGNMVDYSIYLAVILSSLMFAYAGFLFLTNNGNPVNITKAWAIFRRALLGTIAILAAWLIVNAIMTKLAVGLDLPTDWNSLEGCQRMKAERRRQEVVVPAQDAPLFDIEYAGDAFLEAQRALQIQDAKYDNIVNPEPINFF